MPECQGRSKSGPLLPVEKGSTSGGGGSACGDEPGGRGGAGEDIAFHSDWDYEPSASAQYLWVNTGEAKYGCRATNYQRASAGDFPPASRYHIRLWYIPAMNGEFRRTVGTPHHEDFVTLPQCPPTGGHAVDSNGPNGSGFDQGRHALKEAFLNGYHEVTPELWGNSANFQQCDGDYAGSDGWGIRINLEHMAT